MNRMMRTLALACFAFACLRPNAHAQVTLTPAQATEIETINNIATILDGARTRFSTDKNNLAVRTATGFSKAAVKQQALAQTVYDMILPEEDRVTGDSKYVDLNALINAGRQLPQWATFDADATRPGKKAAETQAEFNARSNQEYAASAMDVVRVQIYEFRQRFGGDDPTRSAADDMRELQAMARATPFGVRDNGGTVRAARTISEFNAMVDTTVEHFEATVRVKPGRANYKVDEKRRVQLFNEVSQQYRVKYPNATGIDPTTFFVPRGFEMKGTVIDDYDEQNAGRRFTGGSDKDRDPTPLRPADSLAPDPSR